MFFGGNTTAGVQRKVKLRDDSVITESSAENSSHTNPD